MDHRGHKVARMDDFRFRHPFDLCSHFLVNSRDSFTCLDESQFWPLEGVTFPLFSFPCLSLVISIYPLLFRPMIMTNHDVLYVPVMPSFFFLCTESGGTAGCIWAKGRGGAAEDEGKVSRRKQENVPLPLYTFTTVNVLRCTYHHEYYNISNYKLSNINTN